MEVLHKENTLGDFMCVGAKFPTLKKQQPISSRHLVMERKGMKEKGIRITVYWIKKKKSPITTKQVLLFSSPRPFLSYNHKKQKTANVVTTAYGISILSFLFNNISVKIYRDLHHFTIIWSIFLGFLSNVNLYLGFFLRIL